MIHRTAEIRRLVDGIDVCDSKNITDVIFSIYLLHVMYVQRLSLLTYVISDALLVCVFLKLAQNFDPDFFNHPSTRKLLIVTHVSILSFSQSKLKVTVKSVIRQNCARSLFSVIRKIPIPTRIDLKFEYFFYSITCSYSTAPLKDKNHDIVLKLLGNDSSIVNLAETGIPIVLSGLF